MVRGRPACTARSASAARKSAGASCQRIDGTTWTTDKDGIVLGLLAAEIAPGWRRPRSTLCRADARARRTGRNERIDAPATPEQKRLLLQLSPAQVDAKELAGEAIRAILTTAPGNGESIGGLKIMDNAGWFAGASVGHGDVYKLYAESFRDRPHLERIQAEAQALVTRLFAQATA
jgi:phosphoglucomutase